MILRECEILVTSVQFSSVQLWQTLCDPMDCSTPGFHVPSPTPRIYSNSYPLSWWCCATISSSVIPFSSCLQSFPASGSFQMSQLFTLGGQSIGFSFNISPSNEYSGLISYRIDWFDLLAVQGVTHKITWFLVWLFSFGLLYFIFWMCGPYYFL